MKQIATLLLSLVLAACPAFADEEDVDAPGSCPMAVGTLADGMENRVVYTAKAGYTTPCLLYTSPSPRD